MLPCRPFHANLNQKTIVEDSRDPAADAEKLEHGAGGGIVEVFLCVRKCICDLLRQVGLSFHHSEASLQPGEPRGMTRNGQQLAKYDVCVYMYTGRFVWLVSDVTRYTSLVRVKCHAKCNGHPALRTEWDNTQTCSRTL